MPLADVRILDLTQVLAGPFASRTLGDLGAEVIKVEPPGVGDAARSFLSYTLNGESFYFLGMNRNKKSVTINLKSEGGRQAFYALTKKSDVVFSNFRPGVTTSLGVDYETLSRINPRIICCSISGFGATGPERDLPAFDPILQAAGGVLSLTGEPGGAPMMVGFPIADLCSGDAAVQAILAALYGRERSGQGQDIDLSMFDVQIHLQGHIGQYYLASGEVLEPLGAYNHVNIPAGSFPTSSGYITISCTTQKFWENLARVLAGMEGYRFLQDDPRFTLNVDRATHKWELIEILERAFRTRTTEEWLTIFKAGGVPCAPISNVAQALNSPQAQRRHMVVEAEHPVAGTYKMAGNHLKLVPAEEERFLPAPLLGQHTEEVLTGIAGYSPQEVEALRDEGAI